MDPQIDPRRAVATRQDSIKETILEILLKSYMDQDILLIYQKVWYLENNNQKLIIK
jgi:hypothetical protein